MSLQLDVFFNRKKCMGNEEYIFLLLNNVISILDLFKILTHYIDDKKSLEIRNKQRRNLGGGRPRARPPLAPAPAE